MIKQLFRALLVLGLLSLALVVAPGQPAQAAPPLQGGTGGSNAPGYSLLYSISSDPTNLKYTASFTPDVQSIYAFALVVANKGAPAKQFTLDIQFLSPTGQKVASKWYSNDNGTVQTVSDTDADAGNLTSKNVTRRQLDIAGTPNAQLGGQWSVNFIVGGKVVSVGNFTLAGAQDISNSDTATSSQADLQNKYNVSYFDSTTNSDGDVVAVVIMDMVSQDIYSSDTSQQVVDGFTALRQAFSSAQYLITALGYNTRYQIVYIAKAADFDTYVKSKNFNQFASAIAIRVFDTQAQQYLDNSKDFIRKNFGAGSLQAPVSIPSLGVTTVGSIRIQASPSTIAPNATAVISVTVYDKRNNPIPNMDLSFTLTGTGSGSIRPKVTSTDAKGQAQATFTAGSKEGTVNLTATASKVNGTAVLTVQANPNQQASSGDPAADNVAAYLASKGLKSIGTLYDPAKGTAIVAIDLGNSWTLQDLPIAILYGMVSLRDAYPNATTLGVMIPYQQAYFVVFPSPASAVDDLLTALQAAGSDKQKQSKAFDAFFTPVYANASVLDAKTGQVVSTFKDFANKNFGG